MGKVQLILHGQCPGCRVQLENCVAKSKHFWCSALCLKLAKHSFLRKERFKFIIESFLEGHSASNLIIRRSEAGFQGAVVMSVKTLVPNRAKRGIVTRGTENVIVTPESIMCLYLVQNSNSPILKRVVKIEKI